MNSLKSLLEALKATTYGVLAVLLPGSALVELFRDVVSLDTLLTRFGAISYLAVAYVIGVALQGIAAFVFSFKPLRLLNTTGKLRQSEEHAQRILEAKLGEKIACERLFDLCLSRVESQRAIYDKFIALRDMSRGLTLVAVSLSMATLASHYNNPTAEHGYAFLGSVVACAAFVERYKCFAPLGRQIVFAQFISRQLKPSKAESISSGIHRTRINTNGTAATKPKFREKSG